MFFLASRESENTSTVNGVDMPAVLIECANINNKEDAAALKDDKVINSIAYHVKEGILAYLRVK